MHVHNRRDPNSSLIAISWLKSVPATQRNGRLRERGKEVVITAMLGEGGIRDSFCVPWSERIRENVSYVEFVLHILGVDNARFIKRHFYCRLWRVSETHTKRQATQHGCLPSLPDKGIEIVYGEEEIFCTEPTRAAKKKAEQNLLYRHDKSSEPTKNGPLSFALFESPFPSQSNELTRGPPS
jgi:hypothetical protein